ncbi:hypothetical protein VNO78_08723 [Psophocarpus tetragonolobus]|uniref:Uncharacterized protein n=1 Tax=Psophocarpus tetragonolobus TaxID=3891 RepID=A0AAN9T6B7_PSOTE
MCFERVNHDSDLCSTCHTGSEIDTHILRDCDQIKYNVDGYVRNMVQSVLRDPYGRWVAVFSKKLGTVSILAAEMWVGDNHNVGRCGFNKTP